MAYPTIAAPYGLRPVQLIGGQPFAGQTREFVIATTYGTDIIMGDVVKHVAAGGIEKDIGTSTATPLGIFMGCRYTEPSTGQVVHSDYWPASNAATDAVGFIVDDPDILFQVASVSSGTTIESYGRTVIGLNVPLVQNTGNTTIGTSGVAVDGSSAGTTLSLPVRIVDVIVDTVDSDGEYSEFLCKWNEPYNVEGTPNTTTGGHFYRNPIGV